MASAAMGSTAMNAYIENATGIAEGGRTGLTALVVESHVEHNLLLPTPYNVEEPRNRRVEITLR